MPTAAAALALVACGTDPEIEAPADDDRTAEGEVLGGTISDEMLPLDNVRSQAPPLREEGTSSASTSGAATAEPAGPGDEAGSLTPEPDPDATAATEPEN
ncbi:MAG: hypothetical protein ACR2FJ_09075 [Qipengyuania sp.]